MKSYPTALNNIIRGFRGLIGTTRLRAQTIRDDLPGYSGSKLKGDLRAGLNVALLAFPQGMAYAVIAGLPIHYGITCSIVAALLSPLWASTRFPILGPTNATAFMVFSYFASTELAPNEKLALMPTLVLMVGVMLVIGASLKTADILSYISRTVIVGFVTGAAVLIIANQLPQMLGISLAGTEARTFFSVIWETLSRLPDTQWMPLSLGIATLLVYFFLIKLLPKLPVFAITLALMSAAVALLAPSGFEVETFTSFHLADLEPRVPVTSTFLDDVFSLFGLALAVAFLASLENSVMAKSLANRSGESADMNQDMFSVGMANVGTAILSGMPASGSLTRSALNFNSGAATRFASIFSALFCLAGLFAVLQTGVINHVPRAALAALVICVAITLINGRNLRIALGATKSDAITVFVTIVSALIAPLHVAIFVGVGTSVMLYLRKASRPQLVEYEFQSDGSLTEAEADSGRRIPAISIVHVEGELFFGAAELFRTQIQRTCNDPNLKVIILRLKNARHLDATSVMALDELIRLMRMDERHLIISGAMKDVYRVLKNSGLINVIGRDNIFLGSPRNPNISTRNALRRAQELLGTEDAEVRIFYDPAKEAEGEK